MSPIRFSLGGMFIVIAIAAFFLTYLAWVAWPFVAVAAVLLALMAVQWPIVWLLMSRKHDVEPNANDHHSHDFRS
jgi:hypothetical protein